MIFNSASFCLFFVIVFLVYYFPLKENTKGQNWLLLLSSYFFYGYANWKIIPILLISTVALFYTGKKIHQTSDTKKSNLITTVGVLMGVALLLYFKYFNFFIESFSSVLTAIGITVNIKTFNIIMPIGISFFTFKLISYIVEINRGKIDPCNDFVSFSTYIAFFPTILSGPIDKPNSFIPQLQKKRSFNYSLTVDGCRQILWGLFQKVVIADNIAKQINPIWEDIPNQSGSTLFVTAILYSIQIYTDFSGYSHMAIGIGKVLGFRITKNFNYPYFSRNIAEFWRNWHMSLTSWLTDYVFMPLNIKFRNLGEVGMILAIVINMTTVGLWHGPNWTFALFGLFQGLLFVPLILSGSFFKKKKLKVNKYGVPTLSDFSKIAGTFFLVTLSFVVFRAETISQAYLFLQGIIDTSLFTYPNEILEAVKPALIFSVLLFIIEWYSRETEFPLHLLESKIKKRTRWILYFLLIFVIGTFMATEESAFIYFQF